MGAERFITTNKNQCCAGGSLVLDRVLPEPLKKLISEAPGFSKQSRCGNDLFRFAQVPLHGWPQPHMHLQNKLCMSCLFCALHPLCVFSHSLFVCGSVWPVVWNVPSLFSLVYPLNP